MLFVDDTLARFTVRARKRYWTPIREHFELPERSNEELTIGGTPIEFLGRELSLEKDEKGESYVRVSM